MQNHECIFRNLKYFDQSAMLQKIDVQQFNIEPKVYNKNLE